MQLRIDSERVKKVGEVLYNFFSTTDIHKGTEMPEDIMPDGVIKGSLEHILFITLTTSIDYQRDSTLLWESARKTFNDPQTRYLFEPKLLYETPFEKIVQDMQKYKLSKKPIKDANTWRTLGVTFYNKWGGDPHNFLKNYNWDVLLILEHLKTDTHFSNKGIVEWDYPNLRGPKIGPLWLRMLRDNVGIEQLKNLDKVPIPVDIHVVRATLTTGVVKGQFKGRLEEMFKYIRKGWFEIKGLKVNNKEIMPLDMDKPLWHLSKDGCTQRDTDSGNCPLYDGCIAKEFCVKGIVKIEKANVELDT